MSTTSKDGLGFVGLGRMGAPIAGRLLDAGHSVHVFDARPGAIAELVSRGAIVCSSPRAVASVSKTVLLSLPTPDIVRSVTVGEDGLATGEAIRTLVDLSTTGPTMAKALAHELGARGIDWVDAPVSGGVGGARAGTLTLMVSCRREVFEAGVEKVLEPVGRSIFVGEMPGLGQTAKLVNNLLAAAALSLSAEGIALGVKAGMDPAALVDIVNASSGRNGATQDKFPRAILSGTFDYGFATALAHKDIRLCLDEAEALGVPMPLGSFVRHQLALTLAKFGQDCDYTSIVRLAEEWAGVEIRR